MSQRTRTHRRLRAVLIAILSTPAWAQTNSGVVVHDGQHDFDFEIGTWKTHVARLLHPLTGSTVWGQYDGTSVVSKVWNGRANLVELEAEGPQGHLELASLRLYNPESHQWSLNVASSRGGSLGVPTMGEFKQGRGEFLDQETFNPRHPRPLRDLRHHGQLVSLRAGLLRRQRPDLGSELDRGRHPGSRSGAIAGNGMIARWGPSKMLGPTDGGTTEDEDEVPGQGWRWLCKGGSALERPCAADHYRSACGRRGDAERPSIHGRRVVDGATPGRLGVLLAPGPLSGGALPLRRDHLWAL